jgi:hypothetical protein
MVEDRPRRPTRQAAALVAAASTAVSVLAVAAAETGARWLAPDYLVEKRGLHVFSTTLGWKPRAGAATLIGGRRVSINADGYRGRELSLPRPRERTRVVVLGDSIAFGLGVSDEHTFVHLLDERNNGIEAANLAVQGYGPDQELLVLLGQGLRLDPDVVVLAFCLDNDFADAMLPFALYDGRTPKPRFRLEGDRLVLDRSKMGHTLPQRVARWLSDYSFLFNRLSALGPQVEAGGGPHWTELKHESLRDGEHARRLCLSVVRRMDTVCRERGIAFVVVAFPHWHTYRSKPWLPERFLDSLGAEGIGVLDMSKRFRARGQTFWAIAQDLSGHLTPRGHAIAAEELEAAIAALPGPIQGGCLEPARRRAPGFKGRTALRSPQSGAGAP